jgi:hypothetical protein
MPTRIITDEHRIKIAAMRTRHAHSIMGMRSGTYNSWRAMKARCFRIEDVSYYKYGGRGIKVCQRWLDFKNFLADMGMRPNDCTLDRIDGRGHYEPGNCRWATVSEQRRNQTRKYIGPLLRNGNFLTSKAYAQK